MKKSFKYRLYATPKTLAKTEEVLNLCRILYNLCLEQRKNAWKYHQKSLTASRQMLQLPDLKKAFPEFVKVPSQTRQDVIQRLDKAYQAFFRRIKAGEKPGFPRFKSADRYDSFVLKQAGWHFEDKCLFIKNIGKFKIKLSRPVEGTIKTLAIRKSLSGKWYVCFSCDDVPAHPLPKTGKVIGVDMGCDSFLTDSNGRKIDNPRFVKESEQILTQRQQSLSGKVKGSHRRKKARVLVAKIHEKVRNQRNDFHFKTANQLLKENDTVYIEKLNNWKTFRCLNRSMRDVAWFNFFSILKGKAVEADREIVEVPARGTSQNCSGCGKEVPKDLSVRIHSCPFCGLVLDRDYNAALNVLRLGQSLRC